MQTEIIKIKSEEDYFRISAAGEIIKHGGLVAFPTETVYGLGGNALDGAVADKIYSAKGRPSDNPLIVHIAVPEDAEKYCVTCPLYYKLAARFMPGPLTIILPKRFERGIPVIPAATSGGLDSVALRCPSNRIAHELICASGVPIAAPSANISGSPSPTSAEHVFHDLSGKIDAIIDGGECDVGLESTVIRIERDMIQLLRPGAVTAEMLCEITDKVVIASDTTPKEDEHPLSPGMKYRHYSPGKPLTLLSGSPGGVLGFFKEHQNIENCAIICYSEEAAELDNENLFILGARDDLTAQAHRLFDCLRAADNSSAITIYAHLPEKNGIGLALYNRLIRAAGHKIIYI